MSDWTDQVAEQIVDDNVHTELQPDEYWNLVNAISAALRDAAAEGRRNAIETLAPPARAGESAALIGRQVEPRDA